MAVSHTELKARLVRLANSLLPMDKPLGDFLQSEEDRMHAYVLLAHAEIEDYLEQLGRDVVLRAKTLSTGGHCSPVISRLIYIKRKSESKFNEVTPQLIDNAATFYESIIKGNHGIKEINVMRLFMPLGLTHSDFETILMGNLNTFGRKRGGIAHTSKRLKQGSQPTSERESVDRILLDLALLDQKVRALA